tara:strand:+ start:996 stop:1346 length:351 start_codon:yes stop_codon:yes gene_type:complete
MKITKSQLQKVIQEEFRAHLNEEMKLPANVTRLLGMIMNDAGDEKVAAKLKELSLKMSINLKVLLAQEILDGFGIPYDPVALKTAMTKGMQQQKKGPMQQPDTAPPTDANALPDGP